MFAALRLRSDVFVVEQDCVYPDLDNKDALSIHLVAMSDDATPGQSAHATARLVAPGVSYSEPSIGRVAIDVSSRGSGLGMELMERAIRVCQRHWPNQPIRISAQQYLIRFYNDLGFVCEGEGYLEDGIPHIEMVRAPENVVHWQAKHAAAVERFSIALSAVSSDKMHGRSEQLGAAEVVHHLELAERSLWSYLAKKCVAHISDLPKSDLDSDLSGIRLIRDLQSNRKRLVPTTELISSDRSVSDAIGNWRTMEKGYGQVWLSLQSSFADPAWWTVKLFKHPLSGYLSLSDTFAFAAAHIDHHVKQLERLNS
tara:strand:- start:3946 stop:4881 length:936 start_codon:yes stop_codon:yes gene_type:complete